MASTDLSSTPATEPAEVQVERRAVPIWLFIVLFLLIYWAMLYFDLHGGWFKPEVYGPFKSVHELAGWQPDTGGIDLVRGKTVYDNVCGLCHNPDGAGKPSQAPRLPGPSGYWSKTPPA